MGKVRVNTDLFMYTVPAAEAGKAPEPRTAYFGEVVELDGAQEKAGRDQKFTKFYRVGATDIPAVESVLVDVDYDAEGAAVDAAKAARRAQLRSELAALGEAGDGVPTLAGDDAPPAAPGKAAPKPTGR